MESSSESLHTEPSRNREGLLSSAGYFSQTVYGLSACWDCLWGPWMVLSGAREHGSNPKSATTSHHSQGARNEERTKRRIPLLDRSNAFRKLNYQTDAFYLTQLSWSWSDLTGEHRLVFVSPSSCICISNLPLWGQICQNPSSHLPLPQLQSLTSSSLNPSNPINLSDGAIMALQRWSVSRTDIEANVFHSILWL